MNLMKYYYKKILEDLIYKHHKTNEPLRTFRSMLLNKYKAEYVTVRSLPSTNTVRALLIWEIKAFGNIYFYEYNEQHDILKCVGVREYASFKKKSIFQ